MSRATAKTKHKAPSRKIAKAYLETQRDQPCSEFAALFLQRKQEQKNVCAAEDSLKTTSKKNDQQCQSKDLVLVKKIEQFTDGKIEPDFSTTFRR